jgi:hypothetical protein
MPPGAVLRKPKRKHLSKNAAASASTAVDSSAAASAEGSLSAADLRKRCWNINPVLLNSNPVPAPVSSALPPIPTSAPAPVTAFQAPGQAYVASGSSGLLRLPRRSRSASIAVRNPLLFPPAPHRIATPPPLELLPPLRQRDSSRPPRQASLPRQTNPLVTTMTTIPLWVRKTPIGTCGSGCLRPQKEDHPRSKLWSLVSWIEKLQSSGLPCLRTSKPKLSAGFAFGCSGHGQRPNGT